MKGRSNFNFVLVYLQYILGFFFKCKSVFYLCTYWRTFFFTGNYVVEIFWTFRMSDLGVKR